MRCGDKLGNIVYCNAEMNFQLLETSQSMGINQFGAPF